MTRLFVSLYLVIIFGIFLINWSSEAIWQQLQDNRDPKIEHIETLALTIAQNLTSKNKLRLAAIIDAPITLLNPTDIQWLKWQSQELNNAGVVISFDRDNRPSAYVLHHDKGLLIKLGPMPFVDNNNLIKNSILLCSYLVLALIVALWIWPLWRDLRNLQQASKRFAKGEEPPNITINNGSVVAGVLNTFNDMMAQISRLIEEQKELTNAVSHEIRTPLARLKFAFAMLENDTNQIKHNEQVQAMREDVGELESLVDEILNYGRLESQGKQVHMVEVNLNQLLTNLVEKLARNQPTTINLTIDPQLSWRCDGHFIERACQNYITNALRYAQSQVHIVVWVNNDKLHIDVEDDGVGIDHQDAAQLFKAFIRLDKSRNKEHGGFGLGLAIVKRIVQWHQGQCLVTKSALGGANFSIILPRL